MTFFINPVSKQMRCNCWTATGDQSIYFSHVYWETTYKLRLYLSYNSSQVWPTRISGVIESVFRCSGPNSKSIVTLTRPTQRTNASLRLLPLSWVLLPLATLILIIVKQKSAQGARSLRQMQFRSMPKTWNSLRHISQSQTLEDIVYASPLLKNICRTVA